MALGLTLAGTTAAMAYLDARFHLRKDARVLLEKRSVRTRAQKREKQDRLSAWYDFEDQAARLANEECLWYRAQPSEPAITYTWTQTYQSCCRMAQFLLTRGVRPHDLVGTYLINSPEFVFNLAGCWAIGCAPALINYNLSGDALVHSLKIAESKILLVEDDESCIHRIEESRNRLERDLGITIVIMDAATKAEIDSLAPVRPGNELRTGLSGGFPLFLFYTSGTTGLPKACAFPTAATGVLGNPRHRTTNMKTGPNADTWYDCMPMYHGTGCTAVVGCLISGSRLAIGRRFSVRHFWQDIHDSNANNFIYVGETARYLLAAPPSPQDKTHNLKSMYGNGMRPDIWRRFIERFNIPLVNEFFNSTEGMLSLLNICQNSFHDGHVGHHGAIQRWLNYNIIVPVQTSYEDGDTLFRDPKTGFAIRKTYDEGGEILVRCNSVNDFVGYWNNPAATRKKLERDVFEKGDLWYRTGDALRRDSDGRWFFLDRLGDTFRWKSENVSSQEVAEMIGRHPEVKEAIVYGVELPNHDGKAGCAAIYIAPADRIKFDYARLYTHLGRGLPKYAVPVFIRLLQKQSPMHNNKQNKVPLRKDGVEPRKINDEILWLPPGGTTYVPFGESDWNAIVAEKARL